MYVIAQMATSFFAAAGFALLFNAPQRSLIQCGIVGMVGWLVHLGLIAVSFQPVPATVVATIVVGLLSRMSAKTLKKPILIFYVGGIIPLVPGGVAYNSLRSFVENNYYGGVVLAAEVMILSGGIAIGLMFAEVMNQLWKKIRTEQV